MSILRVVSRPVLRRPILLVAFSGWGDAGAAATGAMGYLLGEDEPVACATADPEACFDFTVQRPITRRGADGRWRLDYAEIGVYPVERPDAERDLLILRGPEPHTCWPTISREISEFVKEAGVEIGLTFGAFIGPVSHRKTPILRRTPNPDLDALMEGLGFEDTPYAGPTAFVTAMVHALDDAGVPAASIWAATAPYLGSPNPAVSLALLEAAERVLDAELGLGRLSGLANDFSRKVESALRSNPEIAERLGQLVDLDHSDESTDEDVAGQPEGPPDLPSGRDLVEELERYLRDTRGQSEPGPS